MKKIVLLTLIAAIFIVSNVFANTSDSDIDKLKRATALVVTYFFDKNGDIVCYKVGTGFFVDEPDKRLLVTAFHVVSSDVSKEVEASVATMEINISYGYEPKEEFNPKKPKNFKTIYPLMTDRKYWAIDEENDLIVFDLKDILNVSPKEAIEYVIKKKDLPEVGAFVKTMGHTFGEVYFNLAEGKVTNTGCPLVTNFSNVSHGNSGGCIINEDLQCVGILVTGYESTSIQGSTCSTFIYPLVIKLESSSKGEEKAFNMYFPPDDYKRKVIMGKPNFNFGNK